MSEARALGGERPAVKAAVVAALEMRAALRKLAPELSDTEIIELVASGLAARRRAVDLSDSDIVNLIRERLSRSEG